MTGKAKRFMEDLVIFVIVAVFIAAIYFVTVNFILNDKEPVKEDIPIVKVEDKVDEPDIIIKSEELKQDIDDKIEKKEPILNLEKKETREKNIDIEKLKVFIKNIENNISKSIVYDLDDNKSLEEKSLKIRITLLKSGDYEQLKFIDGDEKLFEKNKENITNIFPLSIDQDIIEEFPRYIRIELRKNF